MINNHKLLFDNSELYETELYESRHSDGGAFERVSFDGSATGNGSSSSSSHNYSESDYYDEWSSSGSSCDYDCGCDSSGYTSDYYNYGSDSSSNASYNYAANWNWNIDGTKSSLVVNDVTGHDDYSCYYDYDYVSYSSDYGFGYGCCCHHSSDDDDYCCYNPPLDYNDTINYTGWSNKGGQTNLPSTFSLRWSPFNGDIHDEDSCGYGCYSYNGATFSAPNFSVTMYDESYDGEEYETNDVWHKGRSIYGSGSYLYSGTAPVSHIPNNSVPTAPSTTGNTSMPDAPVVYAGNPNFGNFAIIDTYAIIDAKYTKLDEPVMPEPVIQPNLTNPSEPVNVLWATITGGGLGTLQGGLNLVNGLQDIVVGCVNLVFLGGYNLTSWGINKLGGDNPYMNIPSPDWSRGLVTHESGEEGTWSDTHGWSKFAGAGGLTSGLAAAKLTNTSLGLTTMSELPGVAWNSVRSSVASAWSNIKNARTSIKSWWNGTPKTVTTNITPDVQTTLDRIKNGIKFPHRNDGTIFQNREGVLPTQPSGYYREYVHPTPGIT